MHTDTACPGCGFEMSQNALAYHYPFVHGPRPQLLTDFLQRPDAIIRCVVTRDDEVRPWSIQEHQAASPAPTTAPHQPALL